MRVFQERGILDAKGRVLSHSDLNIFSDLGELEVEEKKASRVIATAERYLTEDIPQLLASDFREYFINGNRSNFENKVFLRRNMTFYLSMAEYLEGQGRFTEKLVDVIWATMEESTWILPAHLYNSPIMQGATLGPAFGENNLHGIALFSACAGATLAAAYYLCRDVLDKVDLIITRKMEYTIRERCIRNYLQTEYWWCGNYERRTNNWNPWIISNTLFAAAVIETDDRLLTDVVSRSIRFLDNFLNCYEPDGGCDEGPNYWGAAGAAMFDCLELIEVMTGGSITVYDSELVRRIGEYICKVNISRTKYVNFADSHSKAVHLPSHLTRFGKKTGSRFLEDFGKKQAQYCDDFLLSYSHPYRSLKCMFSPTPVSENCVAILDVFFPDLEVMTARESSDSDKGMFLAAKGGTNGEMHNHNDVGNFIVYYDGEPVIMDAGVGTYTRQTFSKDRYKLRFMQSGYHNLPSFDGVDEHDGIEFRSSDVTYCEKEHKMSLELKHAYLPEAGIISYRRAFSLNDGVVTVGEDITLDKEREIDFHILTVKEPVVNKDSTVSLDMGRALYFDTILNVSLEELDPVELNAKVEWGSDKLYRLHFKVKTDKCNVIFTIK